MVNEFLFGFFEWSEMRALLEKAEADPLLSGFVYPADTSKARLPILNEKKLIGFATPRQDEDGVWRMGAIWVLPEFRNRGVARKAIADFMEGKRGRAFIEDDNISSQKAYAAAGFRIIKESREDKWSWWENF
jgi:RimJ/RimL family protein N-acetyltransferase